jgi:AraC-like DNA-binding protein
MDSNTFVLNVEPGGKCVFDLEPTNSQHRHPYWEICLVLKGTGEYIESGTSYPLRPFLLFVSPPDVWHEIRSLETRDLELFFVSLSIRSAPGSFGSEVDSSIEAFLDGYHTLREDISDLLPYVDLINQASAVSTRDALAKLFVIEAMTRLTVKPQTKTGTPMPSLEVQRALRFIDSACTRPISVTEVAEHVNLAPRTLLRRFLQQVGHGVAKEIRQKKMRRAAHHLLMGYSVQEVARSVGIEDPSQFSAAFLAEIGQRPKHFQQTYLPGSLIGTR